jgi:hypothetical protein
MNFNPDIASAGSCLLTNLTYLFDFINIFFKKRPGDRGKTRIDEISGLTVHPPPEEITRQPKQDQR